jgi:hypothetical protein
MSYYPNIVVHQHMPISTGQILPITNSKKRLRQSKQQNVNQFSNLDIFKDKDFWITDQKQHEVINAKQKGKCCFTHIIGEPEKDGIPKPIFDYEIKLFNVLQAHKYVWVKKARGLGITEFLLRYILWLIFKNDNGRFTNAQIGIITGPRIHTAIDLIKRLKQILTNIGIYSEDRETIVKLEHTNTTIQAFPSNHMNAFRGFTNMKFILLDEADFFRLDQQQEAQDVSQGYIPKSDPQIVMVSTPNNPGGMFDRIESDADSRYEKVFLPYTVGLDQIYDPKEIDEAKHFPSFEREYNLKYGYGTGNVFQYDKLQWAIQDYNPEEFDMYAIHNSSTSIGIDPGFGSSNFGICVCSLLDGIVTVLEAEEFVRPDFQTITDHIHDLVVKYQPVKIYVDASSPSTIQQLKIDINENPKYEEEIKRARHERINPADRMRVVPVGFGVDGKKMLATIQYFVNSSSFRISPKFDKLITQMRTAKEVNGLLDKSVIQSDSFDALRLAINLFDFSSST